MIITRGPPARPSWTPKGSTGPLLGTTGIDCLNYMVGNTVYPPLFVGVTFFPLL